MNLDNEIILSLFIIYGIFVFFGVIQIILDVINDADDLDSSQDLD
jgi:hypothetical protein